MQALNRRRCAPLLVVAGLLTLVIAAASSCSSTSTHRASTPPPAGVDNTTQAQADLQHLKVIAKRSTVPGYERSCSPGKACSFGPAWTDDQDAAGGRNGCDTRNDLLRSQLQDVQLRSGSKCVVMAGQLNDPYTGQRVSFSKTQASKVQIDHVVPLALAWDLGASAWSQAQRVHYANDEELVLLAVDQRSNEQKGDSGPAEWMPANSTYRCAYDERFVTILARYQLSITAADKAAIARQLHSC